MTTSTRKLKFVPQNNVTNSSVSTLKLEERENPTTGATCCSYNNLKLNPPFDSAMALTVLVLLTALFFMGFFSIYMRRFGDEPNSTRRVRTRTRSRVEGSSKVKGLEAEVIESLPVHGYYGGGAKEGIEVEVEVEVECAICLSEFEEREWVKEIPSCGHVFHVECIDTWLKSHVTCPLCRTAKLFPGEEVEGHVAEGEEVGEGGLGVGEVHGDVDQRDGGESNTWNGGQGEVRPVGATSALRRSLSF